MDVQWGVGCLGVAGWKLERKQEGFVERRERRRRDKEEEG